ncbi:unnamed protein product [Ectocarpus sp. CCAP 1310/34]|nr:unnamed protein product [Ectocarpus sp. CCAP 1310/34]
MTTADRPHSTRNAADYTADMSLKITIRDDEHSVVAVEVEGGDACMRSSPAEEQRQEGQEEQQQQQQQQQQQGEGGETAGGEEGDAPHETGGLTVRVVLTPPPQQYHHAQDHAQDQDREGYAPYGRLRLKVHEV